MTSVVEPQKQAPTGQTEGKFGEAIEGVVTLPLAEVCRGWGEAGVQGSALAAAAAAAGRCRVLLASAAACSHYPASASCGSWFIAGEGEALRRDGAWPGEGGSLLGGRRRRAAGRAGPRHLRTLPLSHPAPCSLNTSCL